MSQTTTPNPDTYVQDNKEALVRIVKHGDDKFVRAMALAALVEYGDDPELHTLTREIEQLRDRGGA